LGDSSNFFVIEIIVAAFYHRRHSHLRANEFYEALAIYGT